MIKDEALNLALEALKRATNYDPVIARAITAIKEALAQPEQEPVAWEGGEGWESLAWELCADENGEDSCNELIWEGGPIPEPWGDRWMKYEEEAKRLIALVQKHTTPPQQDKNEFKPDWDEKLALTEEVICLSKRIEELEAQPSVSVEQEPVAWMRQDGQRVTTASDRHNYPDYETRYSIPLYITPPQRKPLTDEMTKQMRESCDSYEMRGAFVDGWLSAEAAHGIKE